MFFSDFFFNLQIENVIERKNAKNATKPGTPRLKWLKYRLAMSVCLIHLWLEKYNTIFEIHLLSISIYEYKATVNVQRPTKMEARR